MATTKAAFTFNDSADFERNLVEFSAELAKLQQAAGPTLSNKLADLADGLQDAGELLDSLFSEIVKPTAAALNVANSQSTGAANVPASQSGWFLEGLEIEGFRGINNEGSPLTLKFKPECVSSISAPNGVGKSSIFDALSYAIQGNIPKLDRLLQAEKPQEYYLNRFHPGGIGTVKLTLKPDNGGQSISIAVTRDSNGVRKVTCADHADPEVVLRQINREFVLLDAKTFQSFIDDKALDRGRSFSGLLGLSRYSALRQQLQSLSNTRSFNTHFDVTGHAAKLAAAQRAEATARAAIADDYQELVKENLIAGTSVAEAQSRCHAALHAIPVLKDSCAGKEFIDIQIEECLQGVRAAEGGPDRERLAEIIRDQTKWSDAIKAAPTDDDANQLVALATTRDKALQATAGDLMHQLYKLSEQVMLTDGWSSPTFCPTCDRDDGSSVLDRVQNKLKQFDAVSVATTATAEEWASKAWNGIADLEALAGIEGEAPLCRQFVSKGEAGTITASDAVELLKVIKILMGRASLHMSSILKERAEIESRLPPSLVAVTTAVETARRLQTNWIALANAEQQVSAEKTRADQVSQVKTFVDQAASVFAGAESAMAITRLEKIEPLCQDLFGSIMYSPVKPALSKSKGGEELSIKLEEFWGLKNVSAQALLSESFRNGFAVSVYLAAASLYGGAPRFIVLDDVTSSFDAGHQHHLVEVMRTRFARPVVPNGPQVIFLSHDTMLEKLFNKYSGSAGWSHQRLEGTARTAVLLQSGAVNKVRDVTIDLLNVGRVDDAAPRVRQYLEYTLHTVIDRCRIPVPLDLAFNDEKRTPGEYLSAIEAAVKLHQIAGSLVLDAAQVSALQMHSAMIVGNFLSHWSTGQAQAFSAPALLGVMQAIEDFPNCFKYEPAPGVAKKFYSALNRR